MRDSWHHIVNELLYSLTYTEVVTDETVDWIAESAVNFASLRSGPDTYRRAIHEAMTSGQPLDSLDLVPQFDQQQLGAFLRAVDARLDALRPWPKPRFREIDPPEAWEFFREAVLIARLDSTILDLNKAFGTMFRLKDTEPRREALVLTLKTGETIGLLATFEPKETIYLLSSSDCNIEVAIEHFVAAAGFSRDQVIRL